MGIVVDVCLDGVRRYVNVSAISGRASFLGESWFSCQRRSSEAPGHVSTLTGGVSFFSFGIPRLKLFGMGTFLRLEAL